MADGEVKRDQLFPKNENLISGYTTLKTARKNEILLNFC